jgi:hypothetical protein
MSLRKGFGTRAGFQFACYVFAVAAATSAPARLAAQHDDDHDANHGHGSLHFSHPMVTESPSPDTKFRLDAAFESGDEPPASHTVGLRGEFEYAFSPAMSLAVVAPFVRVTSPRGARTSSLGNVELSAKLASYAFAGSGALVGGGLSVGLPTGSDAKAIGSGHLYEVAPFVDAAVRRDNVEIVGMLTYSANANRNAADPNETSLTLDGSVLWRFGPQVELLGEMSTSRSSGTPERAKFETFLAPGLKWHPAAWPKLAFGVAGILGVGDARKINALQTSAFYHF